MTNQFDAHKCLQIPVVIWQHNSASYVRFNQWIWHDVNNQLHSNKMLNEHIHYLLGLFWIRK